MSLFKRGGVYWSYVYVDGVRFARSTQTGNKRIAERIDEQHKEELRLKSNHLPELRPQMTFAELVTKFLATGSAKPWHIDRLKILLPYFEKFQLVGITKGAVRQFRRYRHDAKTLTETTVNRDVECLRHLLYFALDEGLIAINPLARVRLERVRRTKKPVLSVAEEVLLLPAAAEHLQQIVIIALDTGMRRGEILSQRWEDIDFERRILSVTHSKTPEGQARELPLTARVLSLLSERQKSEGLIFTFQDRPIRSLKTAWHAAIRRAGIRYLRFHYLRHTVASRLLELGVLREVRMSLLGHTFGDTHESYEHVELPLKRDAIERLEAWHKKATESALAALLEKEQNQLEAQADGAPVPYPETDEPFTNTSSSSTKSEGGNQ